MVLGALAGAEMAMRDTGIPVTLGIGVGAAQEYYRSTAAPLAGRPGAAPPETRAAPGGKGPREDKPAARTAAIGA
jgi:hypothetical protein